MLSFFEDVNLLQNCEISFFYYTTQPVCTLIVNCFRLTKTQAAPFEVLVKMQFYCKGQDFLSTIFLC